MKITILNKLNRTDSTTGMDVWYKTIIDGCEAKKDKVATVAGTEVSMGETFTILIPFTNKYKHYENWTDRDNTFTMSAGDVVILGEVLETVTPNNIAEIRNRPNACDVRVVEEREQKHGVKYQLRVSGV